MPVALLYWAEFCVRHIANLVVGEVKTIVLDAVHNAPLPQLVQAMRQIGFVAPAGHAQNIDAKFPSNGGG